MMLHEALMAQAYPGRMGEQQAQLATSPNHPIA
jgi:hypothetical protein